MNRLYTVTLYRTLSQVSTVEVEAADKSAAVEAAWNTGLDWETEEIDYTDAEAEDAS